MRALVAAILAIFCASGAVAETSREAYVKMCISAIEEIPDFSCADGQTVPVTVNGQPVTSAEFKKDMRCDRPSLLDNGPDSDGQCVPGSRILNHSSETAQISVMCRQKHNRAEGVLLFDEIDVIAHDPVSGATCWFQAEAEDKDAPLSMTVVATAMTTIPSCIPRSPDKSGKKCRQTRSALTGMSAQNSGSRTGRPRSSTCATIPA